MRCVWPDGTIGTVAGTGVAASQGDGGLAGQASLAAFSGVEVGPENIVYVAERNGSMVRKIAPALPGYVEDDLLVASEDGSEVYAFDSRGRHLRTLHALTGSVIDEFAYDASGRLSGVTDGAGLATAIERDAEGRPTGIVSPFGRRTGLAVDTAGWLAAITGPGGHAVQCTYASGGLLETYTDARGGVYQFGYDSMGRLASYRDPAGGTKTFTRSDLDSGYEVKLLTGEGVERTYRVEHMADGATRYVNSICCGGASNELVVTPDGRFEAALADGTSRSATAVPDPRWGMQAPLVNPLVITLPGGAQQVLQETASVTLANPLDPFSIISLATSLEVNGETAALAYAGEARTLTGTSPGGRQESAALDAQGRIASFQEGGVEALEFEYDANGLPAAVRQGSGAAARAVFYGYDDFGNPATLTDPAGAPWGFQCDAADRIAGIIRPDLSQVLLDYDPNGNLITVTPPGLPAHSFAYTAVDQRSEYASPLSGTSTRTRYAYDTDRRLTRVTRPDGSTVSLNYGAEGRLTEVVSGDARQTFTYDTAGRLVAAEAFDGGLIGCEYDGFVRTGMTWSGAVSGAVALVVDDSFLTVSETVNGGHAVAFAYEKDRLLTQAGDETLMRDAQDGFVTGTALGGVTTACTYNLFGELATATAAHGDKSLYAAQYADDKLGRVTSLSETIEGRTDSYAYKYDDAGRLAEVRKNGILVISCAYDGNGNRLTLVDGAGTHAGVYDGDDRLVQYGSDTLQYTPNGELAARNHGSEQTRYGYDALGNLVSVELADGRRIDYVLDARLRRVGKKIDGVLVQGLLYNSARTVAAELDGVGAVVNRFVYATQAHVPDYLVRGGKTYRIVTDHLGSPRLVVDADTGAVAQRMDYDAFGNVLQDTNPGFQPFGFAGGLYDRDTKLVHFGAREYNAETARWTSKDPVGFQGGDTNLYAYAQSDPVNWVDPSGLKPGDFFPSEKDAARQALKDINAQSKTENREFSGGICKKGSKYYYTRPKRLGKDGGTFSFTCKAGSSPTAYYHTHGAVDPGYRSEDFSQDDWDSAMNNSINGYLGTPQDAFRGVRKMSSAGGISVWGDENYGKL